MKYHIVPKTGNPGRCEAQIACPFGDESEHYSSPDEARTAYEKKMSSSPNVQTLATYEATLEAYRAGTPSVVSGGMKAFIDASLSDLPPGSKVLELGSGLGRDSKYLESLDLNVTATDATDAFVSELQKEGLKAQKLNIITDGFPRSDAIFANAVFLHLSRDEFSKVLSKAYSSLNGYGKLVFTVKEGEGEGWSNEKLDAPRHFTYWKEGNLKEELEKAGFEKIEVSRDESPHATWLQVSAARPKAKKKNVNRRLPALSESSSYMAYSASLREAMTEAPVGSTIVLNDGREFTKSGVSAYGPNAWIVVVATHKHDPLARLEPGRTYDGGLVGGIIARVGGTLKR